MLVLSRKQHEGLVLQFPGGKEAKIWVSHSGSNSKVKIVIDAPREISVGRIDRNGVPEGSRK